MIKVEMYRRDKKIFSSRAEKLKQETIHSEDFSVSAATVVISTICQVQSIT